VEEGWIRWRQWLANELAHLRGQSTTLLLALAEKLAGRKSQLPDTLGWMLSWYRDLVVCPFQPGTLINSDLSDLIRTAAAEADRQRLMGDMRAVQSALQELQTNANPRLTMESLVLQLAAD
jgi:DNA polymerase-3 subunit delta'